MMSALFVGRWTGTNPFTVRFEHIFGECCPQTVRNLGKREDKDLNAVKKYKNAVNEIHEWSFRKGTLLSFALYKRAGDDIINELLTVPDIEATDEGKDIPPLFFAHHASKEIHLKLWNMTAPNNAFPIGITNDHYLASVFVNLVYAFPDEFIARWRALNDSERTRVMGPKNDSLFFYLLAEHEKSFFVVWNTLSDSKKKEMALTYWNVLESVTGHAAEYGNKEVLKAVLDEVKDDPKLLLEALKGPEGVYGPFHRVESMELYDWLVKNYVASPDMMHEIASKEKYPPLTGIATREVSVVIALYNAYPNAVKVKDSNGDLPIHVIVYWGIRDSNGSTTKDVDDWKKVLKTLLQTHRTIQLTATNLFGKTALDIAKEMHELPESLHDMLDPKKESLSSPTIIFLQVILSQASTTSSTFNSSSTCPTNPCKR